MKKIVIIFVSFAILLTSCKNKKITEEENWNDFNETIAEIQNKKNIENGKKQPVEEKEHKDFYGIEIIDGKESMIQYTTQDMYSSYNIPKEYNFSDFWNYYKNKQVDEFLEYYENMENSDINHNFGIYHFENKLQMLLLSNQELSEIKSKTINHRIIVHDKYTDEITILNSKEIITKEENPVKILYKIEMKNEIKQLADSYHYVFDGSVSDIEEDDDGYIIKIKDASIFVDGSI